jgi:glycosyltransferase involved in cell wall biosynthesis
LKISIIIPAYNEEQRLGETLRHITAALASFIRRSWETEVIVCDNNSTDQTAEIARAAGAKVVFEPINQIARARNCGAAAASGNWLLFVDADSHPSDALFEAVAEQIATGNCVAGGCTVKLDGHYPKVNFVIGLWNSISRSLSWMAGAFIFCEAGAFREIGGFNIELFAGEEIDLSIRLKKLARTRRKRVVIIKRHSLITSARKVHLYSFREHVRFLIKASLFRSKTLSSREACFTWYDGRR